MQRLLLVLAGILAVWGLPACGDDGASTCRPTTADGMSIAREWNEAVLEAIRNDFPAPTVHARNLYHLSAAMWDAWTAFDDPGSGVFHDVELRVGLDDVQAARSEAISHAAHTLLVRRYSGSQGGEAALASFDAIMDRHCYSTEPDTDPASPSSVGREVAGAILAATIGDGSNEPLGYQGDYTPANVALAFEESGTELTDPMRWQPLAFSGAADPFDIGDEGGEQTFTTPQWGSVVPFALAASAASDTDPQPQLDPGPPPVLDGDDASRAAFVDGVVAVIAASAALDPANGQVVDMSPGAANGASGVAHARNPATGKAYASNPVALGDWGRVIAEFWADGPDSETPPGHWNTIANAVSDHPDLELRIGGDGPVVERLEWDVRMYLALNGALHDAAIAAWDIKAAYDYARPISMIRYMGGLGQSSEPDGPSFHPDGLPLVDDLIAVVTVESASAGGVHEHLADHIGEVTVRGWVGPAPATSDDTQGAGGVDWILAADWLPYQQADFVTPAFPGYVSGHSAFSRAAAEVLTALTGDEYFPGGMMQWSFPAGSLGFEAGPSADVELQWATYRDAADEAGLSRIYGGIHVPADDLPGREIGARCGELAWERALELWAA